MRAVDGFTYIADVCEQCGERREAFYSSREDAVICEDCHDRSDPLYDYERDIDYRSDEYRM